MGDGYQEIPCVAENCPFSLPSPHYLSDHPIFNTDRGIYPKYVVFKHPQSEVVEFFVGSYATPDGGDLMSVMEEVDDFCFVLKPIKDKHARIAMAAYAESVKEEKPQLAADLYEILGDY